MLDETTRELFLMVGLLLSGRGLVTTGLGGSFGRTGEDSRRGVETTLLGCGETIFVSDI